MALNPEGLIRDTDLAALMVELWGEHFTGALRLEDDAIIKIIYFRDGDLVSASTNDSGDSIGEILLRGEKLTREHLKGAMNKRKEEESIADTLLALGFISKKELTWARRAQLVGVMRSVLSWTSGNYAIVSDYLPRRQEGTSFLFPQVLLEVFLTESERARFDAAFPGGSAILTKTAGFDDRYAALGLNDEADEICELIDGTRSVSAIAAANTADSFNVLKLLYSLEVLGLLERETEEAPVVPEVFSRGSDTEADWKEAPLAIPASEGAFEDDPVWRSPEDEQFMRPQKRSRVPMFLGVVVLLMLAGIAVYASRGMFRREIPPIAAGPATGASRPLPSPRATVPPVIEAPASATVGELAELPAVVPVVTPVVTPDPQLPGQAQPEPTAGVAEPAGSPETTPSPAVDAMRARYDEMASSFQSRMGEKPFAIQFAILCQTSSVTNAMRVDGSNVWFVPIDLNGRPCYRAFFGRYDDRESAEAALLSLPETLRQGSAPAVVRTR